MKFGQLLSFIVESLPDHAQQGIVVAVQRRAADVGRAWLPRWCSDELGRPPDVGLPRLDRRTGRPPPASVRSTGPSPATAQVVAVKVQYPGVGDAIEADLDNAEVLYRLVSAFALKGLDAKGLVDELRERMRDELDYRIEAAQP